MHEPNHTSSPRLERLSTHEVRGRLSPGFRNGILDDVLSREHELSSARHGEVLKALKKAGVANFKNGRMAGKQNLRKVAAGTTKAGESLFAAVWLAWLELRPALVDEARAALKIRQSELDGMTNAASSTAADWCRNLATTLASEATRDVDSEGMFLALASLLGQEAHEPGARQTEDRAPMFEDSQSRLRREAKLSGDWAPVLDALERVPEDSSAWDEIDTLLEAVRERAQHARDARTARAGRSKLKAALERLAALDREVLDFHDLSVVLAIAPAALDATACLELTAVVEHLGRAVAQHTAEERRKTTTRVDRQIQRDRLSGLEGDIQALASQALEQAGKSSPDPEPPSGGEPESLAEIDDAGQENRAAQTPDGDASPAEGARVLKAPGTETAGAIAPVQPALVTMPMPASQPAESKAQQHAAPPPDTGHNATTKSAPGNERQSPPQTTPAPREPTPFVATRGSAPAPLLLDMLAAGDLWGAYWLSRAENEAGATCAVHHDGIAVLQGACWLDGEDDPLLYDLLDSWGRAPEPRTDLAHAVRFAAALPLSLLSPTGGFNEALREAHVPGVLGAVARPILEFAAGCQALRSADLESVESRTDAAREAARRASEARTWVDTRGNAHSTSYSHGRDVWVKLKKQLLDPLLKQVASNQMANCASIRAEVSALERREQIIERIRGIQTEVTHKRTRDIVGDARDQLVNWTIEAVSIARSWLTEAERLSAANDGASWLAEQARQLRDSIDAPMGAAALWVRGESAAGDPQRRARAGVVNRVLNRTCSLLRMEPVLEVGPQLPDYVQLAASTLEQRLAARALWAPGAELSDTGLPAAGAASIARALSCPRTSVDVADVVRGWLSCSDFRWTYRLLDGVTDEKTRQALEGEHSSMRSASRKELSNRLEALVRELEQAVVAGVVEESRRGELLAPVDGIDPAHEENVGRAFWRVKDAREGLQRLAEKREAALGRQWAAVRAELSAGHPDMKQFEALMSRAFRERDFRVIAECLETVPALFQAGEALPARWGQSETPTFDRFAKALPALCSDLREPGMRMETLRGIRPPDGHQWSDAPEALFKRAEAWLSLSASTGEEGEAVRQYLPQILFWLGFRVDGGGHVTPKAHKHRWRRVTVTVSGGDQALVPEFGSEADGSLEVLCVWDRQGVDMVSTALRDSEPDRRALLVVHFAPLDATQRRNIAQYAKGKQTPVVLDEALLVHLATYPREQRLSALMRCTLPYSWVNPYRPDVRGAVPPEVFVGRRSLIDEILRPETSCIVYGGRRLGKSALLEEARRQFHRPEDERHACVIDINNIGDPKSALGPEEIWTELRDHMKSHFGGLKKVTTKTPKEIQRHVRDWMAEQPNRRLLVLLDEADDFLDADARLNFHHVADLRNLMRQTNGRFKVVLAGLHNVQRFQAIPNQPLSHLGRPIRIGPLEPAAAYDLVSQPLGHLGYRIDAPEIMRILSATNYHAGLIQLFCRHLVERMKTIAHGQPPFTVQRSDVEAVYSQIRQDIRNRFDWTLRLDPHYQAIAWTMALRRHLSEAPTEGEAPSDLLAATTKEWPAGFASMSPDRFGSYLDEMRGLGVLVAEPSGRYRFRSPNVLELVGTATQVIDQLHDLGRQAAPEPLLLDSHRPVLTHAQHRPSCLTHAQERAIAATPPGLVLLAGSDALGLRHAPESVLRFAAPDSGIVVQELTAEGATDVSKAIAAIARTHPEATRIVGVLASREKAVLAPSELNAVHSSLADAAQSPLLVVCLGPRGTATWIQDGGSGMSVPMISLTRWDVTSIRQRLQQLDLEVEYAERILDVTGGWPLLLELVLPDSTRRKEPLKATEELRARISAHDPQLVAQLTDTLGLQAWPEAGRIWSWIAKEGAAEDEELLTLMVQEKFNLTAEPAVRAMLRYLRTMGVLVTGADVRLRAEPIAAAVLA